jgi:O-antigen/teichoic acid export membrane protein
VAKVEPAADVPTSELDDSGLRAKVTRGLGWKLLSQIFGQGTNSAMAIVLAHLLSPRDFGLAGMALVFGGIAATLSDLSLGVALVQRKVLTEEDRSTVFWTTVGAGLACAAIGVAVSPLVADFFGEPEVGPLFAAVACGFAVNALGQTQSALLTREMSFRALELRQIASVVAGAGVAVGLALGGFGPWTIVGQSLCTYAVASVLVWRLSPWRPRLIFSRESLRSLGSFGMKALAGRLLVQVNINGDNLLIGRFIGSSGLGVYSVAYNVMILPMSRITTPISNVFYAAFARLQNEPLRLGDVWLRVNRMTSALLIPTFLGLVVVAPDFVPVVLGGRWHAAIPVLQLLSIGGIAQSLQVFNGPVYQAYGKPGLFLRFMLFSTSVTFGGFVVGLHWGVVGVAASFAFARWTVLAGNMWLLCRTLGLKLRRAVRNDLQIALMALAMALAVEAARRGLLQAGLTAGPRLVLLILIGMVVYLALVMRWSPDVVRELQTTLRRRG